MREIGSHSQIIAVAAIVCVLQFGESWPITVLRVEVLQTEAAVERPEGYSDIRDWCPTDCRLHIEPFTFSNGSMGRSRARLYDRGHDAPRLRDDAWSR